MGNMDNYDLEISLKNIRAVECADIILDGITVLVGENGCGKSTISKLVYHLFKTSIEFDSIVDEKLRLDINRIYDALDMLSREFSLFIYQEKSTGFINEKEYIELRNSISNLRHKIDEDTINAVIDFLIEKLHSMSKLEKSNLDIKGSRNRIKRILEDSLSSKQMEETESITSLLEKTKVAVVKKIEYAEYSKEVRPIEILYERLDLAFYDNPIPQNYKIKEYQSEVINPKKRKISPFYSVQNIAYIDSPIMLGIDISIGKREHWEDINRILKKRGDRLNDKNIDEIFKKEIIKGDTNLTEDTFSRKSFVYTREDGREFDLLECATGIKSFAILQILFKNGFLNKRTLLVIDEPEVHLHPQWVVEYARLIVLLHKNLGVKFLIASHHPDMVSAIKYISEKEEVDNKLHFYLAEKMEKGFKYNYKELGTDIEAIFESFNIAFERMDLYGNTE